MGLKSAIFGIALIVILGDYTGNSLIFGLGIGIIYLSGMVHGSKCQKGIK